MPGFVDQAVKAKKWMPPADYDIARDWAKSAKQSPRGAFLKNPRKTFTVEVAERNKKRAYPGPAEYQSVTFSSKKQDGATKTSRAEKACEFIEEAKFRGTATPAAMYDPKFVRLFL